MQAPPTHRLQRPLSKAGFDTVCSGLCTSRMERLGLLVKSFTLQGSPIDSDESASVDCRTGLHDRVYPGLNVAEGSVAMSRGLLRDNLATLVPHEELCGQAARCLNLGATQHHGL